MIDFSTLPVSDELKQELNKLEIDFVFQPIFYPDGSTIFGHEALMRPKEKNVLELIDEYRRKDKLHILEVATIFGAVKAYNNRGYKEYITINSFPAESFTEEEEDAFNAYFGKAKGKGIIEILEYTTLNMEKWHYKKEVLNNKNLGVALDDFGTGNNNIIAVDVFGPRIVKLDRTVIANINEDIKKQEQFFYYLDYMHKRGVMVLAEGVETKAEFDFLVENEIDLLQGYYLARPA
ncbi:MAG: EAL domain-containing protein [Eubacteriales bacterium]|nr:EAL domain-containing protein [Eubacteriales bacterium]